MFDPLLDWLADNRWVIKPLSYLVSCATAVVLTYTALALGAFSDITQAASGDSDNACVEIGNVRGVYIAHCVDPETGRELYANSIGFIEVVE